MLNIAFYRVITHAFVAIVKVTHDGTDGFMRELRVRQLIPANN